MLCDDPGVAGMVLSQLDCCAWGPLSHGFTSIEGHIMPLFWDHVNPNLCFSPG